MDKDVLLSILGIIASLVVTIRYILGYFFKKQSEQESTSHGYVTREIKELREIVTDHQQSMAAQTKEIKGLEIKLDMALGRYSQFQDAHEVVLESLKNYVETNNHRIVAIEGRVVELGNELYMIKSKGSKG